jgi:hypothetical protein
VYLTTNLLENKIYIGISRQDNPNYLGGGKCIREAVSLYGKDNFRREILEICASEEHLNEREKFWISFYDSTNPNVGYNRHSGGKSSPKRKVELDSETEKKILQDYSAGKSLDTIGKNFFISRNKVRSVLKAYDIVLRSRSDIAKARKYPEETRLKMSESKKGSKNNMAGKTLYQAWVEKYGKEEADKRLKEYSQKMNESLKRSHEKRKADGNDWGWSTFNKQ